MSEIYQVPTPEAEQGLDEHGAQIQQGSDLTANPFAPAPAQQAPQLPQPPAGFNSWPEVGLAYQSLRTKMSRRASAAAARKAPRKSSRPTWNEQLQVSNRPPGRSSRIARRFTSL